MYTLQGLRIDGFAKRPWHVHKRFVTVRIDDGELLTYRRLAINAGALRWMEAKDSKTLEALTTSNLHVTLFEVPILGRTMREAGSLTVSVQSLLDSPSALPMLLGSNKKKTSLNVTIVILGNKLSLPQTESGNGERSIRSETDQVAGTAALPSAGAGKRESLPSDTLSAQAQTVEELELESGVKEIWDSLVQDLETFVTLVEENVEIHPFAKMARSVVSTAYRVYKSQTDRDENVIALAKKMKETYDIILAHGSTKEMTSQAEQGRIEGVQATIITHADILKEVSMQTVECGNFILAHAKDRNIFARSRTQNRLNSGELMQRFEEKFTSLEQAYEGQVASFSADIMVARVMQEANRLEIPVDFPGLSKVYVDGAGYNADKQCLPGTRTAVLDNIIDWINCTDDNAPTVRVLLGQAGTGKSTIAHTIAGRFRSMKRLGAAFCFSSSSVQRSQDAFATIALDLADFDINFKAALWRSVGQNLSDQVTSDFARQFETFILTPSRHVPIIGSVVILIDALDEIGDVSARAPLLRVLSQGLYKLPSGFRVLLTARPEPDIVAHFQGPESPCTIQYLSTTQDDQTLRADIQFFIRTELTKPTLHVHGLDDSHYRKLAEHSEGLFQWARVSCNYIIGEGKWGRSPRERYDDLIKPQQDAGAMRGRANVLDELYHRVLPDLLDLNDDQARTRFKRVMGLILHAIEPLTMDAVLGLGCHVDLQNKQNGELKEDIFDILSSLGSFLSGVYDRNTPVRPLHSSFRDFLTIETRSKMILGSETMVDLYIGDASLHHANLAMACVRVLHSELHFNMCKLETSYRLNRDVLNLHTLVERFISSQLSYASRFWAQHVDSGSSLESSMMSDVQHLLEINFLFWVEALSLLGTVNSAAWALSTVIPVIALTNRTLADLATDGLRFVRNLARPISESTPHIYISALSSCPARSLIFERYHGQYPKIAHICRGRTEGWPGLNNVLRGHTHSVGGVAISPDGKWIASGSSDTTIRLWDAETGEPVGSPLDGHSGAVQSITISPDGKRIASGSSDCTIRIWDAETGQAVRAPLEGHTRSVNSVAFSPDGMRIVSCSSDRTVRVWDAQTGEPVRAPLKGHRDSVHSAAFSPDGKRIVSGSSDGTVRIWDVKTGQPAYAPLTGHSSQVNSVAFSPDGKRIVSASSDCTLRVWNAEGAQAFGNPMQGHSDWVRSVAFSPDGSRIASCSDDRTIRLWDSQTVTGLGEPLEGHGSGVVSVTFFPDGKRIVSGSGDGTIRVWDVEQSNLSKRGLEVPDHARIRPGYVSTGAQTGIATHSSDRIGRSDTGAPVSYMEFCPDVDHHSVQPCVSADEEPVQLSFDDDTGWIACNEADYIFWLPPAQLKYLVTAGAGAVTLTSKAVTLDMSRFVHGERWTECYQPNS